MRSVYFPIALVCVAGGLLLWLLTTAHHAGSGFAITPEPQEAIYLAGSVIPDEAALGGFGDSRNYPKDLAGRTWGEAGAVSLVAVPEEASFWGNRRGFAVRLVNRTDKPVALAACNSRLFLVQEALDGDGNWRAIETRPDSDCGNSFHRVFLGADQYWEFPAPRYAGWFKTRLRFRLEQEHIHQQVPTAGGAIIYSNEFEGSINPSQFAKPEAEEP